MYPAVSSTSLKEYATRKREGSLGQQQKAYSMLTNRKIVPVKTHKSSESNIFIRALIKKSYGEQIRPAVLLFENSGPSKGYCECPVGVSDLCCHVLALLLFLKHFTETKETILALTCTDQIQKWHRRTKKGSIPMMPLRKIKLTSAKSNKSNIHDSKIVPADPEKSKFNRDVLKMKTEIKEQIKKIKIPFETHCYQVLSKSTCGRNTSLMGHLQYRYTLRAANCLADHNYCKQNCTYNLDIITPESSKLQSIEER